MKCFLFSYKYKTFLVLLRVFSFFSIWNCFNTRFCRFQNTDVCKRWSTATIVKLQLILQILHDVLYKRYIATLVLLSYELPGGGVFVYDHNQITDKSTFSTSNPRPSSKFHVHKRDTRLSCRATWSFGKNGVSYTVSLAKSFPTCQSVLFRRYEAPTAPFTEIYGFYC